MAVREQRWDNAGAEPSMIAKVRNFDARFARDAVIETFDSKAKY
jgi:hypothetical protein